MRFRIFTSIVCIIALLAGLSSCILNEDKPQSDYHENVKDFEMYVLSELSDYIVFDAPNIEKSYRYGDSNETLIWFVYFRRQYFYSNQVNEIPPESIIIRVRDMYNKYVNDNPDYYLNRFVVDLRFSAPPLRKSDTSQMYIRYTHLSNYDYMLGGKSGNNLSTINNVSSEWSYFFADNNISIAVMNENSIDQIIEVADNMPQLRYIVVADKKTAEEASKLRPAVEFYYIKDYDYISQD